MNIPSQEIPSLEISLSHGEANLTESNAPPPEMLTASPQIQVGSPETKRAIHFKFSESQYNILYEFFKTNPHPNSIQKQELSDKIGVDFFRVKNWFINMNLKHKRMLEKEKMKECENKNYMLKFERMKVKQALSPCTCEEMVTLENDEQKQLHKLKKEIKLVAEAFSEEIYDNSKVKTQNDEDVQNKKSKRCRIYTNFQINILEGIFKDNPRLDLEERKRLCNALGIDLEQLDSWIQRRKTDKKRKLEVEKMKKIEAENKKLLAENFKLMQSIPASICKECGGYINGGEQETQ